MISGRVPNTTATRRGESEAVVDEHSIVLLGHASIVTSQTGLDMDQRHLARVRGEAARECAVRVSLNHDGIEVVCAEHAVDGLGGSADLGAPCLAPHTECGGGSRKIECLEEGL